MKTKRAVLQVADTGPLESLVVMLQSVGVECLLPSNSLKEEMRRLGCDTVLNVSDLVKDMGYDYPSFELKEAYRDDLEREDTIYVDVKAHRSYPKILKGFPSLAGRILWYRINGAKPEHVVNARGDHGDEVNPPCPVLTPNQWYRCQHDFDSKCVSGCKCEYCGANFSKKGFSYTCWPPFHKFDEYVAPRPQENGKIGKRYESPICLIHNVQGWGYQRLVEPMRQLGVKFHGVGAPDGLLPHKVLGVRLSNTLAMVHLKSSDAPGYAIYEAMAAGCPVVCTRRLIWRCRMQDLLEPGVTCLVFDRETHDGLSDDDVRSCTEEVKGHLAYLSDHNNNMRIGEAGRKRLTEVMWSDKKAEDVESLREFLTRNFG